MIAGAVFVPQAPLLLPGVTGGPVPEVAELRAAVERAVADCLAAVAPEVVVVVGAAAATGDHPLDSASPAGRFAPAPNRAPVAGAAPVALAVGALAVPAGPGRLLGVASDASPQQCAAVGRELAGWPDRMLLVVAGDGTACRDEKAPGHLDQRADGLDAAITAALAGGDPAGLAALDPGLCADLLVAGRAAWQVAAAALGSAGRGWSAEIRYSGSPFGVGYTVATWR